MAYEPTTWKDGDVITAEKMNKLEEGVKNEQVGPAGPSGAAGAVGAKGADGVGIKSVTLTVTDGAVTGGSWTGTDNKTHDITIA